MGSTQRGHIVVIIVRRRAFIKSHDDICAKVFLSLRELRTGQVLRSLTILPMMITPICVGLMFSYILNPTLGIANYMLSGIGVEGPYRAEAVLDRCSAARRIEVRAVSDHRRLIDVRGIVDRGAAG